MQRVGIISVLSLLTTSAAWGATVLPGHSNLAARVSAAGARTSAATVSHRQSSRVAGKQRSRSFLFGIRAVEPRAFTYRSGSLEAFRFVNRTTGSASRISLFLDSRTLATRLIVALYSDRLGHPGSRLTPGSIASPHVGGWNPLAIRPAAVTRGKAYWIAVLGKGGPLSFRAARGGRCLAGAPARRALSSMPSRWSQGLQRGRCSLSGYVSGIPATTDTTPVTVGPVAPIRGAPPSGTPTTPTDGGTTTTPAPPLSTPVNTIPPDVSGTPVQGDKLTTTDGSWTGGPTSHAYVWEDCDGSGANCSAISGANASAYTLGAGDVGHTIRVVVTATNASGSTPATSARTAVVAAAPAPPANTALPVVSGTAQQGQSLSTTNGSWSGNPTSYTYKWQDCNSSGASCAAISGATSSGHTLGAGDVGHTIRSMVTATNGDGSAQVASGTTAVVTAPPAPPANTAVPVVSGTAQQGQSLSTTNGGWSNEPSSYSYAWEDCDGSGANCSAISGANASAYTLGAGDVGHTIRSMVTATNADGSAQAASGTTAVVTAPPANTALPVVSGTAQQGRSLSTTNGSWSGNPTSYTYKWQDCNSSGASCAAISGATSSGYTLGAGDVGHTIRVVVTATNASGSTPATSARTAVVAAAPAPPANTALPVVSGTARQGQSLSTTNGSWSGNPTAYAYTWQDCDSAGANCAALSGATSSSYTLGAGDVGHTIRVVVTGTNASGSTPAASAQTAPVAASSGGGGSSSATGQSVAFFPAWETNMTVSQIPWNAVTQVDLFALQTTAGTGLDTSSLGINQMNVPQWVSTVHQHNRLAIITVGGISDQHWDTACNDTNRSGFVSNLINYMVSNGFDGIDIDIEQTNWGSMQPPAAPWDTCVQAIAQAAHAATTAAGAKPIVSTDVDQTWMDPYVAGFASYPDQFNLMGYGRTCANNCAQLASDIQTMETEGKVSSASKMTIGIDVEPGDAQPQCCYSKLATTNAALSTGSATTSISVASISKAIPAGKVVLATTENPPAHYQVFTTSGAATCASNCSIPVTSQTPNYAYPSGSYVQNDSAGPWDCGSIADFAAKSGVAGVMVWTLQGDASAHNGQLPCFSQIAPYVAPAAAINGSALISQGQPTYSTGTAVYSVSNMVDSSYDEYRCTPSCAGIVHFTSAPTGDAIVSWYNDDNDFWASNVILGDPNYNLPKNFTIDGCSASCTGTPPSSGWTNLETVTNNVYNGGQYAVNLGTGCGGSACTWLRMNVTAATGSSGNTDAAWHLDVNSCSSVCTTAGSAADSWLFVGDSITNNSMTHRAPTNFIQAVNAGSSGFYPSQIEAGVSFSRTCDWLGTCDSEPNMISQVLAAFPAAHFVTLNLGTNDVNGGVSASTIESNLETLVRDVIAAGRVPVVPTIPWAPASCSPGLANDNPATPGTANYSIVNTLYAKFPQVIHGPDLWTYFNTHQSLMSTSNCPHPTTPTGEDAYRALWASTMLGEVYP